MQASLERTELAVGLLILCTAVWGSNAVVGRAVHEELPPVGLAFWRNVIAFLVVLPFAGSIAAQWPLVRRHAAIVLVAGVIGTGLFNAVVYAALGSTTAINAALMMSLCPVVIPVLAFFLVKERLTLRQGAGIAISLVGVAAIVTRSDWEAVRSLAILPGDLWMLLGMLCWSLYSVVVKRKSLDLDANLFLSAILLVAALTLLPFYLWESVNGRPVPLSGEAVVATAYLGIFPTALALLVFNRVVFVLGANRTALFNHLVPVFATLLAIVFLGEQLASHHVIGASLIVIGLYLTTGARRG